MATATSFAVDHDVRHNRVSDEMYARRAHYQEPKPTAESSHAQTCPYCDQPLLDDRNSIVTMFAGGVRRLEIALWLIGGAILRCMRFSVAAVLCLIGLIGSCCRILGQRIAHPDDRRFLPKA